MDPDDSGDDAAALRDRVDALEQTVSEQQATIEALSSPPVSRRGVLAALTGVAGAGALGAYSHRASAQAAGQVGTQSEPVDVEAYDLNVQGTANGLVQNPLGGDLDAGGNNLTNVGAMSAEGIENTTFAKGQTTDIISVNDASSFLFRAQNTDAVGTTAKEILALDFTFAGCRVFVKGKQDGTGSYFADSVLFDTNTGITVTASTGGADGRSYSHGDTGLELAMDADVYNVLAVGIGGVLDA